MANLNTEYLGLSLKNPIIVGSSGLTNNVESIIKIANAGAGAVVLKSLFEEQINAEIHSEIASDQSGYTEAADYINTYIKDKNFSEYITLIRAAKQAVNIPVIASINCQTASEWVSFAEKIQEAGADALELNVSVLPFDEAHNSNENEAVYFKIIEKIKEHISIPFALKMSYYSSGLAKLIKTLSWTGDIQGLVLFNRYYNPDIDINKMVVTVSNVFSSPEEYSLPLRWISLLSQKVECDLCASTGIHTGEAVIKQILAGASAVQIVSTVYKNGTQQITSIINEMNDWMDKNSYATIPDIKGKLSQNTTEHRKFERSQFMKYYGSIV